MKKLLVLALSVCAMALSSCSSSQKVAAIKGDASQIDSLSYALGVNIGDYFFKSNLADLPLNVALMGDSFEEAALGKSKMTSEEAVMVLDGYFRNTRMVRKEIVDRKRAEADSVKRANGVTETVIAAERVAMGADTDMFESEEQRNEVSSALGADLGLNLLKEDLPLHTYWVKQAMADIADNKAGMSNQQAMEFLQNYYTVVVPQQNLDLSKAKLAEVENMKGVMKTSTGLMYRIKKAGDESLRPSSRRDKVKVNYTGRLLRNNEVFDTSRYADRSDEQKEAMKISGQPKEDAPIEFALSQVIRGWTEGMMLVGKGGRIELWIPADLAYGANGAGAMVRPNDALYFDVEVVDVTLYNQEN